MPKAKVEEKVKKVAPKGKKEIKKDQPQPKKEEAKGKKEVLAATTAAPVLAKIASKE